MAKKPTDDSPTIPESNQSTSKSGRTSSKRVKDPARKLQTVHDFSDLKFVSKPFDADFSSTGTFKPTLPVSISRDEIYHRVEWFFNPNHNPSGAHVIPSPTPITALVKNIGLDVLYVNLQKASQTYVPAWRSYLFHGVQIPWVSDQHKTALGIRDCKTFGDIVTSLCLSYQHAGFRVT